METSIPQRGCIMMRKVLIVGPSWVGDMVMAQALFMSLQADALAGGQILNIDVLAPVWSRPLLERMPEVRRAIDLPFQHGELNLRGRYSLGHSLRSEGYDQVIVLPNSFKSALLPLFVGASRRTGWRGEARGLLLSDVRDLDKEAMPLMVQRFVALGRADGEPLPSPLPRPYLVTEADSVAQAVQAMQLQIEQPVLAICPGAEFGDAKQWPAQHYASVSAALIAMGWQVWIMGSKKDNGVASHVLRELGESERHACHDLTGRTSLGQAIDLMSVAKAVVSNDSGLMHVAAALGRPVVAMYGSSSADFTPPLTDQVQLLSIDIDCRPCFERVCPLGHKRCLVDLSPEMAFAALAQLVDIEQSTQQGVSTVDEHSAGERGTFCES
jgi:heptosyltransferase-2